MVTKFLRCCTLMPVVPAPIPVIESTLLEQIDTLLNEYTILINKLLKKEIRILMPSDLHTLHENNALIRGLLNEIYVKYEGKYITKYTFMFNDLENTLQAAIRSQYRNNVLRISQSLIKDNYIRDILNYKSNKSFSAEF